MIPTRDVDRVLSGLGKSLLASEIEAALEVTYLAMAADRSLQPEEHYLGFGPRPRGAPQTARMTISSASCA